jgi:hypothetical protein
VIDDFLTSTSNKNVIDNFIGIKNYMSEKTNDVISFQSHFKLDRIRNQDFFEYFPEHENMREFMKNE